MKEETKIWLKYAKENLEAAKVLSDNELFNPALQNIQQSIEKSLKSLIIEFAIGLKKSHSILELKNILDTNHLKIELTDDEIDLLDSIYLPSKYPIGSALPNFYPDKEVTNACLDIARRVLESVELMLLKK